MRKFISIIKLQVITILNVSDPWWFTPWTPYYEVPGIAVIRNNKNWNIIQYRFINFDRYIDWAKPLSNSLSSKPINDSSIICPLNCTIFFGTLIQEARRWSTVDQTWHDNGTIYFGQFFMKDCTKYSCIDNTVFFQSRSYLEQLVSPAVFWLLRFILNAPPMPFWVNLRRLDSEQSCKRCPNAWQFQHCKLPFGILCLSSFAQVKTGVFAGLTVFSLVHCVFNGVLFDSDLLFWDQKSF